jgi:hypothetical protein
MIKRLFLLALALFAVGMAVPSTRAQIQANAFTPVRDAIGNRLVPRRLEVMANQLDVRLGRAEGLPDNFEGWIRRDYSGPETDPWGNPWYLTPARRSYAVGSMGPDGRQGTDDDITETRDLPNLR